jgi:hypothetical protein
MPTNIRPVLYNIFKIEGNNAEYNTAICLPFVGFHTSYFYNKIVKLHWSMSRQTVINNVTISLVVFISLL